jgi:HK97 family phage portal protein
MFEFLKKKRSWANLDAFEGAETSSGFTVSESTVLAIPAVFACVKVLAESIASLPLIVYESTEDGRERAKNFSLYELLHRTPNGRMTSFELRELMVGHLCLRGNSYSYIERDAGEVVGIWPLSPDRMSIDTRNGSFVYKYQSDGKELTYQPDQILHIKGMGSDGIQGYSPLTLCRDTWGSAKASSDYSANYFKNDASPGGILRHPGKIDQAAHDNLKHAWEAGFKGKGNKHKVAVLEGGMEWQAIGVSPQDSQMIESMKFSVVEICRIFRVPLNLVMDYERSTYSNVTEQNRSFLTHTLNPWLRRIEQSMERILLTESEKRVYNIEHLTAELLRANHKERYETYEIGKRSGFLSTNEIRKFESLNGIGPDGDVFETLGVQNDPVKDDNRAIKKNTVSLEERDAVTAAHYYKIKDAIAELVTWEVGELRVMLKSRAPFDDAWEKFFDRLPGTVTDKIGPTFREFQAEMAELLKTDFKAPDSDVESLMEKDIAAYAQGHSRSTRGQLESLFESGSTEDIEQRLDEWEADAHRAEKETANESVRLGESLFAGMAFASGFKIRSNARGDACPWCSQLSGKVIGRGESMLPAGEWTGSDGATMKVRRPHISPAYHKGCNCFLTYV